MNRYKKLATVAVLLTSMAAFAYAAEPIASDAVAMSKAKITLTQAIATAEQNANGKALSAEFKHKRGKSLYEVDVASGGKVMEVKIDADLGTVLSSTEEKKEHDKD
ncbi:PepSY domain-containing protein [Paraherbaspirillum soli]|uniref:PepSY domain-containing protein n=1 Tax=Paraherbaspirillum soli TaxID=631222 RepID=A0ABW0MD68_9BURK